MSDKKDDDLGFEDKLADDLMDDMDDIDGLDDLDDIDELDELDDIEQVDDDSEYEAAPSESAKDFDELDSEISSLNEELNDLETEEHDYEDEGEDEDDESLSDSEDDEQDAEEDELEALEEKSKKKNALIMKAATGAFVLMIGGFVYNLMFAGELPNEDNLVDTSPTTQPTLAPVVSVDTQTQPLDKTFEGVDTTLSAPSASNKSQPLKTETASNKPAEVSLPSVEKKEAINIVDIKSPKEENKPVPVITVSESIDVNKALYEKLTNGLSRAQAVNIDQNDNVVDQENNTHKLKVGTKVPYYGDKVSIISVFDDINVALLSNGTFIDEQRSEIDERIMKMVMQQKELENKEAELKRINAEKKKDKALRIAQEKAREEERMKAQEQQKAQEAKLQKALQRINSLANEVEAKKEAEKPKAPVPTLLQGWTVNGKFKAMRNGYVLNGFLIRDADGNFYKMLVGDNHEELGLIRGYDGNGRFFIGNSYIL